MRIKYWHILAVAAIIGIWLMATPDQKVGSAPTREHVDTPGALKEREHLTGMQISRAGADATCAQIRDADYGAIGVCGIAHFYLPLVPLRSWLRNTMMTMPAKMSP